MSLAYDINPDILKKARTEIGLTIEQASKNILPSKKLEKVESGTESLTFNQLLLLANRYKLPITYFYLESLPEDHNLKDFRSIRSKIVNLTPEIRNAILTVNNKRDLILEFKKYDESTYDYTFIKSVDSNANPESVARSLHRLFDLTVEKKVWKSEYDALNSWLIHFAELGILVFQISNISVEDMRGFSISKVPYPIIAINKKDSPYGRIFTLMHEFAHLVVQSDHELELIINIESNIFNLNPNENFCNRVAGELLVPESELLAYPKLKNREKPTEWSDTEIKNLQKQFWVSKEVILLRLVNLHYSDQSFYNGKVEEWKKNIPVKRSGPQKVYKTIIQANSPIFLHVLLSAYNQGEITANKLSKILIMKLKHLDLLREEFGKNNHEQ